MIGETIGITIAIVSVSMVAVIILAKAMTKFVVGWKTKKRRRVGEPSPPRKHIMTKVERDVERALQRANKMRGIKDG